MNNTSVSYGRNVEKSVKTARSNMFLVYLVTLGRRSTCR